MRTFISCLLCALLWENISFAQDQPNANQKKDKQPPKTIGIGIKGGYNFASVTNASSINADSKSGFHIGAFYSPGGGMSKSVMGYRTELIYSRQGHNFSTGTTTGEVNLDYIFMPQLMTISITKYFQIQLGMQMGYLLNAKADSTTSSGTTNPYESVMDYYNRFDYGFAGGVEIHPFKGLLLGARLNVSLNELYKQPEGSGTGIPGAPNFSNIDVKNNVLQIFLGYTF